jgi:choline dehydrogenase-like flavoprotein
MAKTYDIVTIGGGLGGSASAKAMAEHGARVLVVERERLRALETEEEGSLSMLGLTIARYLLDNCPRARGQPYYGTDPDPPLGGDHVHRHRGL